jgi:hypothetical protein
MELTNEQEDYILEQGMEDYYEQKEHLSNYPKLDDEMETNTEICCHCGGEFEEWDLDRCDEGWICRECEEKLR